MKTENSETERREIEVQRDFAERQRSLAEYICDVERLPLSIIMSNTQIVFSIDDFFASYEEEEVMGKILKTTKKLAAMKRKNVDISRILCNITSIKSPFRLIRKSVPKKKALLPETSIFPIPNTSYNDKALSPHEIFTKDIEHMKKIKKYPLGPPSINRNLSVSSPHSQFIKKLERAEVQAAISSQTLPGEITTSTAFRNGACEPNPGKKKETDQTDDNSNQDV